MTDTAIARGTSPIGEHLDARWDHNGHAPEMPPGSQLAAVASAAATGADAAEFTARWLAELAGNPLITALADTRRGHALTPDQVQAVIAIVAMLEAAPQQPQLLP